MIAMICSLPPFRPLPPCGAGEEDFQLDAYSKTHLGPLSPRVAGERDSTASDLQVGLQSVNQRSARKYLIHLPDSQTGGFV